MTAEQTLADPTMLHRLVSRLQAARRDGQAESMGAGLLLAATLLALIWANSPWGGTYTTFWHTPLTVQLGSHVLDMTLLDWVNDGLMTLFFFVVGLDFKRELAMGELTDRRRAAAPIVAGLVGMLIPAALYLLLNPTGEGSRAWGAVISTDTAFLLGALALFGPARGARLRVFLLTLSVADDFGALVVIAFRYTSHLRLLPLALAALGLIVIIWLRRLQAWRGVSYALVSAATWLALFESGVQPTLAGVLIALILPVYPPQRGEVERAAKLTVAFRQSPNPEYARAARLGIDRAVSVNERLMRLHEPYTNFVIVPLFALANAGVRMTGHTLADAVHSRITWGVIVGLVVGKLVGITGTGWLMARLRPEKHDTCATAEKRRVVAPGLPLSWLAGGAALSGIGFTMSLFIIGLALPDERLADQARVGVLAATVLATGLGWLIFAIDRRIHPPTPDRAMALLRGVDPERDHIRGPVDAPLTLVEYGDFECPFCSKATGSLLQVRTHFGEDLRYVFRHLPLEEYHPSARQAANAAEAAAAQGKFWEMHDLLFRHHDALSPDDLREYAASLELDLARFDQDMRLAHFDVRVEDDAIDAESSDVAGTPTFYLGVADQIPRRHTGPHDAATLIANLEELRAELDRAEA